MRAWIGALLQTRPGEERALGWSAFYFFALFCCCYLLRPVRDELGVAYGVGNLQWLFSASFAALLVIVPLFGRAAARLPREQLLPRTCWLVIGQVAVFFFLLRLGVAPAVTIPAFFVWSGVFNLFVVSLSWSFMADLFTAEQGKRLFGAIAAGGSAGALCGPAMAAALARRVAPPDLLPVAGGFLLLALMALRRLAVLGRDGRAAAAGDARNRPGGGALDGMRLTMRSPYLAGIGLLVAGYSVISTLLYVQQAGIVSARFGSGAARTGFFATVDLAVNAVTILGQVLVTGRIMRRFGLALTLAAVPLLVACGFAALAMLPAPPGLPLLVTVLVIHRAGSFTLLRPAREVLFTGVDGASRYQAKSCADTLIYRGGDAASVWLSALLRSAGAGPRAVAWVGMPLAALWMVTAFAVGRMHDRELRHRVSRPFTP